MACSLTGRRKAGAMLWALVPILRQTAELAGFEIIGRIPLRDKATGKEYR